MDLQQFAVYFTLAYAILFGLHVIFAGLAAAFPAVAFFGVAASWTGALALDVQKLTGVGRDNVGVGRGMKRGYVHARLMVAIAAVSFVCLVGCSWWQKHAVDVLDLAGCVVLDAAKVAPDGMPTPEQAAQIAIDCGVSDADHVMHLLQTERIAAIYRKINADGGVDAGAR